MARHGQRLQPTQRPKTPAPRRRHVDKYRHLVADRNDRGHRRQDGRIKRPLDKARAEEAAANLNGRQSDPVHAYQCPVCGWWHVGRLPEGSRSSTSDEGAA